MQNIFPIVVLTLVATSVLAQQGPSTGGHTEGITGVTTPLVVSPSLQAVAKAREMIASNPQDAGTYAALGASLCRQAEETQNTALYTDADEALNKALTISANNFEARKAEVCVSLGRHEFARAREQAMILNKRIPDDIMVYGLLVDANEALGNYPEAEDAAQWMLRLRPGNMPALLHAADLREVFGEQQGALQLLQLVLDASSPTDISGRATVLTRMAQIDVEIGDVASAESKADAALLLRPGDARALLLVAKLRLLQGRPADAVPPIRQAYKSVPQVQTLYVLGEALEKAGMQNEARKAFTEFEEQAVVESSHPDNANHELVFYYTDHANNPVKALSIAELETGRRQDVHTLDAYAWALCRSGRYVDSKKQMDRALKIGVREASVFYHAGEIELRLGNIVEATRLLKDAVQLKSIDSQDATIALAGLQPDAKSAR